MIKLKQVLQEFTDMNFEMKYVKDKNSNKVVDALQGLGMGIGRGDVVAATKRLRTYEGGKMFKHMQYHVVQGYDRKRDKQDVYFIYQTQHYLRDHDVDVTQVSVDIYDDYQGKTSAKRTEIGKTLVPTKKFLKGLSRLNILSKS
jgi:hypothetical protein|tara:strand:- start:42 stop:473 length:432 start_codon:yes stop_codon:yes gene_type:complete